MFFSHIPDLLLLEIEIPDINGLELARIIRKKGCQTPIIIYSSHISATCELAAIKTGVDDCIPKNILPELLAYKLQNIYYRICQKKSSSTFYIGENKIQCFSQYTHNKQQNNPDETHGRKTTPITMYKDS